MSYRARRRATECDAALSQEPSSGPCITITIISTITITINTYYYDCYLVAITNIISISDLLLLLLLLLLLYNCEHHYYYYHDCYCY